MNTSKSSFRVTTARTPCLAKQQPSWQHADDAARQDTTHLLIMSVGTAAARGNRERWEPHLFDELLREHALERQRAEQDMLQHTRKP